MSAATHAACALGDPLLTVRPTGESSFEGMLRANMDAAVAPVRAELARVANELNALRTALPPQLVPLRVAAERLGVSYSTARRRIDAGEWPFRRDGARILVDLAALRAADDRR